MTWIARTMWIVSTISAGPYVAVNAPRNPWSASLAFAHPRCGASKTRAFSFPVMSQGPRVCRIIAVVVELNFSVQMEAWSVRRT